MQIVVISGKGGTGKTTLAASFAYLGDTELIKVDCDVDASNLHLMFGGRNIESLPFEGAKLATVTESKCTSCGKCISFCRFNAIKILDNSIAIDPMKCEGCGACTQVCDENAIKLEDEVTGNTIITDSDLGIISRAEMIPGAEGSGKLVTQVRKNALSYSQSDNTHFIIDGSPGVGCSVMASITGCDYSVIVTEPTMSGFEDFKRVYALTKHFNLKSVVVINKYDINEHVTAQLEAHCDEMSIQVAGRIPFDRTVDKSINSGIPIIAYDESEAGQAIIDIWNQFEQILEEKK